MKRLSIVVALVLVATFTQPAAAATSIPSQYAVASVASTVSTVAIPVTGVSLAVVAGGGTTRCYGSTRTHIAKNWTGGLLFSYSQRVEWCARSGRIVGTPYRTRWGTVYQGFYEFRGHIDSSTINRGTSYTAFTQGAFYFCFPGGICPQYRYPFVEQTVQPNGLTYGRNGG